MLKYLCTHKLNIYSLAGTYNKVASYMKGYRINYLIQSSKLGTFHKCLPQPKNQIYYLCSYKVKVLLGYIPN